VCPNADAPGRKQPAGGVERAGRNSDRDALVPQPRERVDLLAVEATHVHLEVQVRAGRLTTVAQQRDGVAGTDDLPRPDQDRVHVAVDGHVAVLVLDVDGQSVAAGGTGLEDHTVHRGVLRRLHRGSEVDARMQRAPAAAEAAGEAGSVDGEHRLRAGRLGGSRGGGLRGDAVGLGLDLKGRSLLGVPGVPADHQVTEELGGVGVGDGLSRRGLDAELLRHADRVARRLGGEGGGLDSRDGADRGRADEGGGQVQRRTASDGRRTATEEPRTPALGGDAGDRRGSLDDDLGGRLGRLRHCRDGVGDGRGPLVGRRPDR
jgi:hypothetical protein